MVVEVYWYDLKYNLLYGEFLILFLGIAVMWSLILKY